MEKFIKDMQINVIGLNNYINNFTTYNLLIMELFIANSYFYTLRIIIKGANNSFIFKEKDCFDKAASLIG